MYIYRVKLDLRSYKRLRFVCEIFFDNFLCVSGRGPSAPIADGAEMSVFVRVWMVVIAIWREALRITSSLDQLANSLAISPTPVAIPLPRLLIQNFSQCQKVNYLKSKG